MVTILGVNTACSRLRGRFTNAFTPRDRSTRRQTRVMISMSAQLSHTLCSTNRKLIHSFSTAGLKAQSGCSGIFTVTRVSYTIVPKPEVRTVRLELNSMGLILRATRFIDAKAAKPALEAWLLREEQRIAPLARAVVARSFPPRSAAGSSIIRMRTCRFRRQPSSALRQLGRSS